MTDSSDSESNVLMEQTTQKKGPDWSKYGLSDDQRIETRPEWGPGYNQGEEADHGKSNELFREDEQLSHKPWWKANFFISEPILFGTWDGVFTSCMINILGVVIFLRMGWIVGNAGIGYSILLMALSVLIALVAALSAIGVCERCRMGSGGIYFLFSHVLGARIGGALGILYCFAQAVSCSLAVMGFGESFMGLMNQDNPWIARGFAIGVVMLLLVINVAGVKWVIRVQLLLLFVLFLSCMDLIIGSFVHTDVEHGVIGYSTANLANNTGPDYVAGENFFTIFGLFFSTVTGILAGINMSGDLSDPFHNIPKGTLASLGVSSVFYLFFIIVLGATCMREYLHDDYMIAEKVSILGVLWLTGLYISSVSSCMGSLYGPPRILQSIANENTIPIIKKLGQGRGPNKVPVYSLVVIFMVVLLFILVGDVNSLAPIVTTAFLITYAAICYAYFALAMSYDARLSREYRYSRPDMKRPKNTYGTTDESQAVPFPSHNDSFEKFASDLDKLFPERLQQKGQRLTRQASTSSVTSPSSPDFDATATKKPFAGNVEDSSQLLNADGTPVNDVTTKAHNDEITAQPRSWYSVLCNRWVSFIGVLVCLVITFSIQWMYALGEVLGVLLIYIYIGQASPGYFPGITEFNLYDWLKSGIISCCRRGPAAPEQIVVPAGAPAMKTTPAQLTEDNEDFSGRERYHKSQVLNRTDLINEDSD